MSRSESVLRACSILWSMPRSPGHRNPAEGATGSWGGGGPSRPPVPQQYSESVEQMVLELFQL